MAASPPNRFELKQTMRSTEYLREGGMGCSRINAEAELNLPPGFRFHPTDEELVVHYLCRKVAGQRPPVSIIADVDLYKHNPWELPGMALFGSKEWYFYTPRERKYPNGSRPNRAAGRGYWKATGADKLVATPGSGRTVGIKKALVFYQGKAPRGMKTDWIMHEYRLIDNDHTANKKGSQRLDEWVLCRLYHKKNSWEKGQQEKQAAAGGCSGRRMDSTEIGDDTRSDNLWTPESDIEQDAFLGNQIEPGISSFQASQGIHPGRIDANGSNYQRMEGVKEEVEWPMDFNPHGLQSTFEGLGSAPGVDFQDQDFYNSIIASFWS